jgi:cytochrome c-type biogenesis protein CcmE
MTEKRNTSESALRNNADYFAKPDSSNSNNNQQLEQELAIHGLSEHINIGRRYSFDDNGGSYLGL